MSDLATNDIGNCTISFCNQVYPAYFGGYQADMIERTALALLDPDSLKRNISNHLPILENSPVVEATVRHYNHAVLTLQSANPWTANESGQKARPEVNAITDEPTARDMMHKHTFINKQPLVSVWGDAVVLVNEFYYWVSINKCDHTTTAQTILDNVRQTFTALKLGTAEALVKMPVIPKQAVDAKLAQLRGQQEQVRVNEELAKANAQTPPVPQNDIPRTSQRVPTDHVEPANGNGKRKDEPNTPPPADILEPVSESDSGTPHFLKFPGNKAEKATFAATYADTIVSFEMQKVRRTYNGETGLPEYELFANSTYQWPSIKYIKPEYIKSKETQDWFSSIEGEQTGRWRVVCYVNQKGDNVYFNVNKVEPIVETVPAELVNDKPAQPKGKIEF